MQSAVGEQSSSRACAGPTPANVPARSRVRPAPAAEGPEPDARWLLLHLLPTLIRLGPLARLVELGMTSSEAIVAGTRNGALAARGLDDFGTIEVGKFADLVLLDANPLDDIRNIRRQSMVMKEGKVIDVNALPTSPVMFVR